MSDKFRYVTKFDFEISDRVCLILYTTNKLAGQKFIKRNVINEMIKKSDEVKIVGYRCNEIIQGIRKVKDVEIK